MPSSNYKSDGKVVKVAAAGAVTAGTPVIEDGHVGVAQNTTGASGGNLYLMTEGEFEVNFVPSCVVGDYVQIAAANNAVTRVAYALGAAAASGNRLLGQVSAVYGAGNTSTHGKYPVTGKMWIKLLPWHAGTA